MKNVYLTDTRGLKRFLLFLSVCMLCASVASAQRISLSFKDYSFPAAIKAIENNSSVRFVYSDDILPKGKVSVHAEGLSVDEVVRQLLAGTSIRYQVTDNNLVILSAPDGATAQPGKITGRITDVAGQPVAGAVIINGTASAVTGPDGRYAINAAPGDRLTISFVGFYTQHIAVGGQTVINVTMSEQPVELENVVVTGYQTISKERATGSFSIVGQEQMGYRSAPNLSSILEGQVAGLYTAPDGKITIRGISTINAAQNPLYVVDGIPIENNLLAGITTTYNYDLPPLINPEDIESITVLKDAAAASIYGARAANGVIVIKTKTAKRGAMEIGFSASLTYRSKPDLGYFNAMTGRQMVDLEEEFIARNPGLATAADAQAYRDELLHKNYYPTPVVMALLNMRAGDVPDMQTQQQLDSYLKQFRTDRNLYQDDISKYATKPFFAQQYNLSLRQATDVNSFNASMTVWDDKHVNFIPKNNETRIGVNIANATRIAKWLRFDLGTYLHYTKGTAGNSLDPNGVNQSSILPMIFGPDVVAYNPMPYERIADDQGNPIVVRSIIDNRTSARDIYESGQYSLLNMDFEPLRELYRNATDNRDVASRINARLCFQIAPTLNVEAMGQYETRRGLSQMVGERDSYRMRELVNCATTVVTEWGMHNYTYHIPKGDSFQETIRNSNAYIGRAQVNYSEDICTKHNVTAIAGAEIRENSQYYSNSLVFGYDPQIMQYIGNVNWRAFETGLMGMLGQQINATSKDAYRNYEIVNRYTSLYGNASYTYDSRLTLSGSIRWDMSNLFGTNPKYQRKPMWSIGGSWLISQERFMRDIDWINLLKFRATYGINGNVAKNSSPYLIVNYSNKSMNYPDQIQGAIESPGNPNLRWERTATTNLGIDAQLLGNRLLVTADVFRKLSTDLLVRQRIDPIYGTTSGMINNGKLENRGVEMSINALAVNTRDFSWRVALIGSYIKSKLIEYNAQPSDAMSHMGLTFIIDKPYAPVMAYQWAGLDQYGNPQVLGPDGQPTIMSFEEDKGNFDALRYMGTYIPPFSGSLTNTFGYKGFELSVMLICNAGHVMRRDVPIIDMTDNIPVITTAEIANRWRKAGDQTNVPRVRFSYDSEDSVNGFYRQQHYQFADINVIDASYIKLRNLSLTYHLPSAMLRKASIANAKVMLSVENLATAKFNDYGIDPESFSGSRIYKNGPRYIAGFQFNF